ncbi:MBL fold metallo-hydrolase [Microbacterium halophytorum]|uniref:MBL fold metallo-hydrolase n=1 Tax=Microbacterium halophytorum TaxID=2067568 RepID=UPI000CFD2844|nr:MBL fold metallo-hydrolase [Microbacterium halophytorum]
MTKSIQPPNDRAAEAMTPLLSAPTRRTFVLGGLFAAGTSVLAACAPLSPDTPVASATTGAAGSSADEPQGDRIILLGVGGGPVLDAQASKPAVALVVNEKIYLVDCGAGASEQLLAAGLSFADLAGVFLTHLHFDHTSGLGELILHGWVDPNRLPESAMLWGPPKTTEKPTGFQQMYGEDIRLFESDGAFGKAPVLEATDVTVSTAENVVTTVMEDDNVSVDCTRVFHGDEVEDAYAYRFTIKSSGKVVVFSGDTAAPNANLINLAQGCDVLVHEAQDNAAIAQIAENFPPEAADAFVSHMEEAHSSVLDLPRVAQQADAKTLVLNHYAPVVHSSEEWMDMIAPAAEEAGYTGRIVAPQDLDVVAIE